MRPTLHITFSLSLPHHVLLTQFKFLRQSGDSSPYPCLPWICSKLLFASLSLFGTYWTKVKPGFNSSLPTPHLHPGSSTGWRKTHRPPDQAHLKFMMSFRCHPESPLPVNIPISPVHPFPTLSKDFSLFNFCFFTHSWRSCLLSHWKNWRNWEDCLGSPDIPPPTCPLSFFLLVQNKELPIFLFKAFPATLVLDSVPSHLF